MQSVVGCIQIGYNLTLVAGIRPPRVSGYHSDVNVRRLGEAAKGYKGGMVANARCCV